MTDKSYEEWMKEYRKKCGEPVLEGETENDRVIRRLERTGFWERMMDWRLKVRRPEKEGKE